jgi:putative transposase
VLLRLAYLTVTNTFALMRLLPVSDRDKDAEILVLRHQIAVLERHLGGKKVRFTPPCRMTCMDVVSDTRNGADQQERTLRRP